jgi:uroporphyrinogen-III synthase
MTTILVTRPQPDADLTAGRLDALGIGVVVSPLLKLRVLPFVLPEPRSFTALALTSANALLALSQRTDMARFAHLKVFAVGDRTAAAARHAGFAKVASASGSLGDLVDIIRGETPAGAVLYPTARHQSGDLGHLLKAHGVAVTTLRVYDMPAVSVLPEAAIAALTDGSLDAVTLYSRRSAEVFAQLAAPLLSPASRQRLGALCISEAAAEPLIAAHFARIALADHPSEEAMLALALSFSRDQNRS